jgi:sugar lactone lactonase YvrE
MDESVPSVVAEVAYPRASTLGEGSLWDVQQGLLYWVDIVEEQVFLFDPERGQNRAFDLGEEVGTVVVTNNDKLLVALRSGLVVFDPETGRLTDICDPRQSAEEGRFNDGKCDPRGRLWVGTMSEGPERKGKAALYCLDSDLAAIQRLGGVTCSNGLCWSTDERTFFYVDTPTYQVRAFDFDADAGTIDGGRVVIELSRDEGAPDGMTIDAEGQLWIALFDGGRVLRIDPKGGERTFQVLIPGGGNVTSCAFGGANLDQLFVTTARIGLSAERRGDEPDAGSLFVARVPFVGVPSARFGRDL